MSRVGMPNLMVGEIVNDTKWEFPTLSPVINEVRRERRIELVPAASRDYLAPIVIDQMSLNPDIKQNPGW